MSDGQSEACWDQMCYEVGARVLSNLDFIARVRPKAKYGIPPLTIEEQRFAFYLLTGEMYGGEGRCKACNGEGEVVVSEFNRRVETCSQCDGDGYLKGESIGNS